MSAMSAFFRKTVGVLSLATLLASCASTPQHDLMLLNITVHGATRSQPAHLSAEFKSTEKNDLNRYRSASLWVNGVEADREDAHILVPFGSYHVGYEFRAKLDPAATQIELVLFKEKGNEYRHVIAVESYRISGIPEHIDPSRDLVLSYQGPDFQPNDSFVALLMPGDEPSRLMGEWSDLVGNRLVGPKPTLTIAASKLQALPKGRAEFKFFRASDRSFNEGDMRVEVTQFSADLLQAVTID
jgi:hypothetical protein